LYASRISRVPLLLVRLFIFGVLSVCSLLAGCSATNAANSAAIFTSSPEPFSEYRSELRHWLERHAMPQRNARDIELNLPFERKADPSVPYRGVYLLFHGLNDSPYVWNDLADELNPLMNLTSEVSMCERCCLKGMGLPL